MRVDNITIHLQEYEAAVPGLDRQAQWDQPPVRIFRRQKFEEAGFRDEGTDGPSCVR